MTLPEYQIVMPLMQLLDLSFLRRLVPAASHARFCKAHFIDSIRNDNRNSLRHLASPRPGCLRAYQSENSDCRQLGHLRTAEGAEKKGGYISNDATTFPSSNLSRTPPSSLYLFSHAYFKDALQRPHVMRVRDHCCSHHKWHLSHQQRSNPKPPLVFPPSSPMLHLQERLFSSSGSLQASQ
jgi:hypothetical protein